MKAVPLKHFSERSLGVIGLGYVGLPVAVEFATKYPVVGFDISQNRIESLRRGVDSTNEVSSDSLYRSNLTLTSNAEDLSNCDTYIVTVPTPIDGENNPDLSPLAAASETVGKLIKDGDIVIFESTVYPGATEEFCAPIIESVSKKKLNQNFFLGYSPERINPGDHSRKLKDIVKITSGSTLDVAQLIDQLYASIITAGTFQAPSIKVAEAAKVIENTQRDLNIALMNELAIIMHRMGIDTKSVIEAASTKWNFLPFSPGLVGGHCIGVDPYYLTHKARQVGVQPDVVLAGRGVNNKIPKFIVEELNTMAPFDLNNSNALVLGVTFKENCPDCRNSKVIDLILELQNKGVTVEVHDPLADRNECLDMFGINLKTELPEKENYDFVILAVPHKEYMIMGEEKLTKFTKASGIFADIKSVFPVPVAETSSISRWRL